MKIFTFCEQCKKEFIPKRDTKGRFCSYRYPELRLDLDNGVTLCLECHKLTDNFAGRNRKRI